jgi:S1-C subfamily serine protease
VIGAGIVAGLLYATGVAGDQATVSSVETVLPAEHGSGQASLNAPAIYSVAAPGVVDITASGIHSSSRGIPPTPPGQSQVAVGTGFEIDSSRDILTAAHVVAGASSITAGLDDGSTHKATVLGVDRSTDVAVLRSIHRGRRCTRCRSAVRRRSWLAIHSPSSVIRSISTAA